MLCLCSAPSASPSSSLFVEAIEHNKYWLTWLIPKRASSFIYVFLRRWRNSYAPIAHVSVQACIRIGNIELSNNKKNAYIGILLPLTRAASHQPHHSQSQESEIAWHNRRRGATCHPPLSGVKGDWPEGIEMGITHSATFFCSVICNLPFISVAEAAALCTNI